MQKLANMTAAVREFGEHGLFAAVRKCIEDEAAIIIDMNVESQLFEQGENRLGVKIGDYAPYHPITVEFKKMKGQPYDRVTLRDTGDFHESFHIIAGPDSFVIRAIDGKTASLRRKYGDEIIGLTEENIDELVQSYVKDAVIAAARKNILYNGTNP